MANARQEVKEAADVITASNKEDGLVPVIENYFLHKEIVTVYSFAAHSNRKYTALSGNREIS